MRLDAGNARVIVGPREALATRAIQLRNINWLGDGALADAAADGMPVQARVRSTRPPVAATLTVRDGRTTVALASDETGVAPGQACVLYDGDRPGSRILGGGVIDATLGPADRAEAA